MKAYFIYRVDTPYEPYLYAVTDLKELKKSFLRERKKGMFKSVTKNLTSEEWYEFYRDHNRYILASRGYYTKAENSSKSVFVIITSTMYEEDDTFIKADRALLEVGRHTDEIALACNNEILWALNELNYFEIYKFTNMTEHQPFLDGISPYELIDNNIDAFNVFCMLYGDTIDLNNLGKEIERQYEKAGDEP